MQPHEASLPPTAGDDEGAVSRSQKKGESAASLSTSNKAKLVGWIPGLKVSGQGGVIAAE